MRSLPRLPWLGLCLGVFLLFSACSKNEVKTPACKSDNECKFGKVCVENRCVECRADAQCEQGQRCVAHACVAAECTSDAQCSDGKVCQAGVCKACGADSECGPGGTCQAGACKPGKVCGKDEECADDEDCLGGFCRKSTANTSSAGDCELVTIFFSFDDATILPSERDRLDRNAACIEKSKGKVVRLLGHSDSAGTEEYNIALSERRAQAVADYLARLGVDPAQLLSVPMGETSLLGDGDDKDRRVEFAWK